MVRLSVVSRMRASLGTWYEEEAADVVQDFCLGLVEGRFEFPEIRRCARVWMSRVIRSMAAEMRHEAAG